MDEFVSEKNEIETTFVIVKSPLVLTKFFSYCFAFKFC